MATQNKGLVVVSPASRAPADKLAQQVRDQIRACQATVLGEAAILSFYKLKPPYSEGGKDPSEILKGNPRENTKFSGPCLSPLLLGGSFFPIFLCAYCICVLPYLG